MKNLISLIAFLGISIVAFTFKDFNLFESASVGMKVWLGAPPAAYLINIALAVYCFSAGVLLLTDIAYNKKPKFQLSNLGYRSAFFVFFCFSGTISANFIPVLLVGISLYGLEQTHISLYNYKVQHNGILH